MAAFAPAFVHLDWGRFELWIVALALGGLAFGALGVAIGAVAREVSAASLLALLLSPPRGLRGPDPGQRVLRWSKSVLDVVAFIFPFRAALQATGNAFTCGALTRNGSGRCSTWRDWRVIFGVLARLAMRRAGLKGGPGVGGVGRGVAGRGRAGRGRSGAWRGRSTARFGRGEEPRQPKCACARFSSALAAVLAALATIPPTSVGGRSALG